MWQLSIRSKIILILLLTGLGCLAAGAIIGYRPGDAALRQSVEDRLTAHREMRADNQVNWAASEADRVALEAWYSKKFLPRLDKVAGSHTPLEGLMPTDPIARRLQADYIAHNSRAQVRSVVTVAGICCLQRACLRQKPSLWS
jgi:hypothetical protein